jgi:hypothetical protein
MLFSLMFVAGLAAADGSAALGVDWTKAKEEKAEEEKAKEKDARTSKYLFIGTVVAMAPGAIAAVSGLVTLVTGGIAGYSLMRLLDIETSGKSASQANDAALYGEVALIAGVIASSCSICAVTSCVGSGIAFGAGVKAMIEDPEEE